MNEEMPSPEEGGGTRFTVDLGEVELTDEEVTSLQNQITKLAVETARQKGSGENAPGAGDVAGRRQREPFVKIIFVRAIHR